MVDHRQVTDEQFDETATVREAESKLERPRMYQVVLLNDDFTPMEFVVELIEKFFFHCREEATQIMLKVHTQGKGVCGVYTEDVAATKVAQVNQHSQEHQHPLRCQSEPCNHGES